MAGIPEELQDWVYEKQNYLDGLLGKKTGKYFLERKRLTEEYEAMVAKLQEKDVGKGSGR